MICERCRLVAYGFSAVAPERDLQTTFRVIICPRQLSEVLARCIVLFKKSSTDQIMISSASSSGKEIRILIADDHPVVREGIVTILALQKDLKVVGQARDGEEACLLYDQLSPDILILDLRMPKKDGQEVVNELMSRPQSDRIVFDRGRRITETLPEYADLDAITAHRAT